MAAIDDTLNVMTARIISGFQPERIIRVAVRQAQAVYELIRTDLVTHGLGL